jgi:hypothetical protein
MIPAQQAQEFQLQEMVLLVLLQEQSKRRAPEQIRQPSNL